MAVLSPSSEVSSKKKRVCLGIPPRQRKYSPGFMGCLAKDDNIACSLAFLFPPWSFVIALTSIRSRGYTFDPWKRLLLCFRNSLICVKKSEHMQEYSCSWNHPLNWVIGPTVTFQHLHPHSNITMVTSMVCVLFGFQLIFLICLSSVPVKRLFNKVSQGGIHDPVIFSIALKDLDLSVIAVI